MLALLILATAGVGCHRDDGVPSLPSEEVQTSVTRLDGSTLTPEEVRAAVERLMSAGKVAGLGLAILNEGKIVYLRGFGVRDISSGAPMTATSVMSAASFSKAMFAHAVTQLVDEGALDLNKPIHEYLPKPLPEYPRLVDLAGDARWKKITARMLLSHTSGLPNWRWLTPGKKLTIQFEPGTKYGYSGEGMELLQLVVEQFTGESLEEFSNKRVFKRFGMRRAGMVWNPEFKTDLAVGHDESGNGLGHKRWKTASAAGSADSDLAGVAAFLRGVLNGDGLGAKAREAMLSPQIRIRSAHQFPTLSDETTDRDDAIQLSYGLGWGVFQSPHGKAFFKEGHDEGWEHYMVAFDDPKTAIILMTNSSNGEGIFQELLSKLIGDVYSPCEWNRYVPYDTPR